MLIFTCLSLPPLSVSLFVLVIAADSRTVKFSSSPYQTTQVKTKPNKPSKFTSLYTDCTRYYIIISHVFSQIQEILLVNLHSKTKEKEAPFSSI